MKSELLPNEKFISINDLTGGQRSMFEAALAAASESEMNMPHGCSVRRANGTVKQGTNNVRCRHNGHNVPSTHAEFAALVDGNTSDYFYKLRKVKQSCKKRTESFNKTTIVCSRSKRPKEKQCSL